MESGKVSVNIPSTMSNSQNVQIQIFDAIGRLVLQSNANGTDKSIELSLPAGLTPGIYGIQISNGTQKLSSSMQIR